MWLTLAGDSTTECLARRNSTCIGVASKWDVHRQVHSTQAGYKPDPKAEPGASLWSVATELADEPPLP